MGEVVDILKAREAREPQPDPAHVIVDDNGVKWFEFCANYRDGLAEMGFSIWALDFEDADRRLALIKESAVIDGQLYAVID